MIARNFKRFERNTLVGFFDVELPPGCLLKGFTLHKKGDLHWVGLPASPQLDRDGKALLSPKTGRPAYSAIVDFDDREARDRFQTAALSAVLHLLGEAAPPREARGFGSPASALRTHPSRAPSAYGPPPRSPPSRPQLPRVGVDDLWVDEPEGGTP